jgi:hypothetical protein
MIDHRVNAREFPHGRAVVVAPHHQERKDGNKGNDNISDVYHLIELIKSSFTAIHTKNGENLMQK